MEYSTKYPKTVVLEGKRRGRTGRGGGGGGVPGPEQRDLVIDAKEGIEQLHIIVRESFEKVYRILMEEGFTRVKFEHRRPRQMGRGLSLKLGKPWEMHVRISRGEGRNILIHAEVEVSRDYMQHLFSQRTPVVYEIMRILEKNQVECRIWNERMKKHISSIVKNHQIGLATPSLPAFAWKPMVFSIGTVGFFYLVKYVLTV